MERMPQRPMRVKISRMSSRCLSARLMRFEIMRRSYLVAMLSEALLEGLGLEGEGTLRNDFVAGL
ncbi:hypothetical protein D3C86_956900 [compost metagenome]